MLAWKGKEGWTRIAGRYVGLPSTLTIKNKPPLEDVIAKAATQEDLRYLKNKGSKHVVEVKKSDTKVDNRPETSNGDIQET